MHFEADARWLVDGNVVSFHRASIAIHSGLLLKLLQKEIPVEFVKLLRLWYSRQTCAVGYCGILC